MIIYQILSNVLNWLWSRFVTFLLLVTDTLITLSNQMAVTVFDDNAVNSFLIFLEIFGGMMFVIGIGFAIADWAINATDGSGETIMTTVKNIIIGLAATIGFTSIPILLLRFVNELCIRLLGGMTLSTVLQQFENNTNILQFFEGNPVDHAGEQLIYPIYIVVMFVCVIKVFLSNVKCGGSLIVLMFVCPMHLFSIPRGYLDAFWSWCRQVVGLCLSVFIQNFLVALSLYFVYSSGFGTVQLLSSMGLALAAFEAPKIMQQFGLDTSIKANATQAVYAANGITSLIKSFGK